jgi:hypothetical protein
MLRVGRIYSIDTRSNSGTLVDTRGVEFFISVYECEGDEIPSVGTLVTFVEDTEYRTTAVASRVSQHLPFKRAA